MHTLVVTFLLLTGGSKQPPYTGVIEQPPYTGVIEQPPYTGVIEQPPYTGVIERPPYKAPQSQAVPPDKPSGNPLDLFSNDDRASRKNERDRCLTAAGAGIAGALVGGALLGAPAYIVGTLQNKGPDGELIGEPNFAYKRYFVPGFTLAGAFIGGALATVGTYYLVEPDPERPGVMR